MPTTTGFATEFITFSRGSLATLTDSNGYIKWAPHNLLLASEQFDTTSWTKTDATVAANTEEAPNGTDTADTLTASGANGTALQSYTAEAVPYTFGVWLKRKTGTGTIEIAADSGTYTAVTITNDWALYTVTQTPAAGSKSAGIRIVTSADEVYAWGAHLYRSDLGGMVLNPARGDAYYPTTPPNLLGYTEAFDNAGWTRYELLSFGSGSVANATIAPNGLQTADLITENTTATASHFIYQDVVFSGTGTLSVYAKSATGNRFLYLRFLVTANNWATSIFDLATGSVTQQSNGSSWSGAYDATITTAGNGWYRCSLKVTASSVANITFGLSNSGTPSLGALYGDALYTGDGTSGIYLWGAQLSDSASLDPYVGSYGAAPSAAAAYGPRLDYDPSTLAAKGLLVEEQRTNLVTYSSEMASWTARRLTISSNTTATTAPDGTTTADKIIATSVSGTHCVYNSVASTNPATFSVYVKAAEYSKTVISIFADTEYSDTTVTFDLVAKAWYFNASFFSASNLSYRELADGWFRIEMRGVAVTGGFVAVGIADPSTTGSVDGVFTGDDTSGLYVWGAQVEAGSFATSYIPTAAATVTRNADVAFVATSQFPLGSTEGTIVTSATPIGFNVANFITTLQDASLNNFVQHYYQSATNLRVNVVASGGTVAEFDNAVVMGATHKVATAFKANDFASSFNGGSSQTDNTGTAPTGFTTLNIGRRSDGFTLNGHIRQITYIPRRLTNAELQQRTA